MVPRARQGAPWFGRCQPDQQTKPTNYLNTQM
jgi:hypothetical protein